MSDTLEITTEEQIFDLEDITDPEEILVEIGVDIESYGIVSPNSPILSGAGVSRVLFKHEGVSIPTNSLLIETFDNGDITMWIEDGL